MKKIICIGIFLICYELASAEKWGGYAMWNAKDGTTSNSLEVIYQGKHYSPSQEIEMAGDKIDRSSPEGLLKSLFRALNQQDAALYSQLYAQGEQKSQYQPDANNKVLKLELRRTIQYGDYVIFIMQITVSSTSYPFLYAVRNVNGEFYASDLLQKDKAYKFLNYYYVFAPTLGTPNELAIQEVSFTEEGHIYMTNTMSGNSNSWPPIIFSFLGKDFGTNYVVEKWPTLQDQDLSSPAGTLAAAIAALNAGDVDRYAGLLHPMEKTNIIQYGFPQQRGNTWVAWLREEFPDHDKIPTPEAIRLNQEINYGDDLILTFQDVGGKMGQGWLLFRKDGANWYISDELNGKGSPIINYLGLPLSFKTKLFPTF